MYEGRMPWASILPNMEGNHFEVLCRDHPEIRVVLISRNTNLAATWSPSISHLNQLEVLSITHSPFGDDALAELARMPDCKRKHLIVANFNDTGLTESGLHPLLAFPNLEQVHLEDNDIPDNHPVVLALRERGVIVNTDNPLRYREVALSGSGGGYRDERPIGDGMY